jgi:uncharacterized protein involved in exopolysaccharide biosynthesis
MKHIQTFEGFLYENRPPVTPQFLRSDIADLQNKIVEYQKEIAAKKKDIQKLQSELGDTDPSDREDIKKKIANGQYDIESLTKDIQWMADKIKDNQKKLAEMQKEEK